MWITLPPFFASPERCGIGGGGGGRGVSIAAGAIRNEYKQVQTCYLKVPRCPAKQLQVN